MTPTDKNTALKTAADGLLQCLQNTLLKSGALTFSQDPDMKEREVIEYDSRMRVLGIEKFDGLCYLAYVNFFANPNDQKDKKTCGALIIFVEDESIGRFLKAMGHRDFSEDDDDSVMQKLGQFCKEVATEYKPELAKLGYADVVISEPSAHKTDVAEGINFPYHQYKYYELNFYFWKKKIVVADIVIGPSV